MQKYRIVFKDGAVKEIEVDGGYSVACCHAAYSRMTNDGAELHTELTPVYSGKLRKIALEMHDKGITNSQFSTALKTCDEAYGIKVAKKLGIEI